MLKSIRIQKEYDDFLKEPLEGIGIYRVDNNNDSDSFIAQIIGPKSTPYEHGLFELSIQVPTRYPFEPPQVSFKTPIYHPNIDKSGRICLDLLKSRPDGNWNPSISLKMLLSSIRYLIANPNVDDPLEIDVAEELKSNASEFKRNASDFTKIYAIKNLRKNDFNNNS